MLPIFTKTLRKVKMENYKLVKTKPVARLYYQGNHSHPVRRTVLIIEDCDDMLVGYELREGSTIRSLDAAPIKSYRKDKIARYGDYSRLQSGRNSGKKPSMSTLERSSLLTILNRV